MAFLPCPHPPNPGPPAEPPCSPLWGSVRGTRCPLPAWSLHLQLQGEGGGAHGTGFCPFHPLPPTCPASLDPYVAGASPVLALVASLKSQGSVSTGCRPAVPVPPAPPSRQSSLSSVQPRKLTTGTSGLGPEFLLIVTLGKAVLGTLSWRSLTRDPWGREKRPSTMWLCGPGGQ